MNFIKESLDWTQCFLKISSSYSIFDIGGNNSARWNDPNCETPGLIYHCHFYEVEQRAQIRPLKISMSGTKLDV